jgi:hypothetical protein
MAKKEAPAKLTGGAGFYFEDHVAARFLLDLLGGTNSLGQDYGRVMTIDWQARDAGWLLDDLATSCEAREGERAAGISIKSHRQVTEAGFSGSFVEAAWEQWLGIRTKRLFREQRDGLVLATGQLASKVEEAWTKTLREALLTVPERMINRFSSPQGDEQRAQSSQLQRALFASLHCPEHLKSHGDTGDLATVRLMRHIRLLYFDYESPSSREKSVAVADCQKLLRSGDAAEAAELWARLLGVAAERRAAGGSATLADVLAALRDRFDLLDHPDYRFDWQALDRHSQEALEDVRTEIPGLPPLSRDVQRQTIEDHLGASTICCLVGESGCGKSALAKEIATHRYARTLWPTAEALDSDDTVHLGKRLGLRHPLLDVLLSSRGTCLVVFDGIEGYSDRALRLAARLMRDIRQSPMAGHVHILTTLQFEGSRRITDRLLEQGVDASLVATQPVPRPSEEEIGAIVGAVPSLRWASLRAEVRPLLTNLKVLDWVVRAALSSEVLDGGRTVGLTTLIERLWERWVEGGEDGFARGGLLMRLATLEAETLSAGVPRARLEYAEQLAIPALGASDLVRVRHERVRFSHDLLGDWARMKVLVGQEPTASPGDRDRAASPRWHRAVRLFGQRLLEQGSAGQEHWRSSIEQLEGGSEQGALLRDLLLEAAFLATNARQLLEDLWPTLIAAEGRLLARLLHQFLYVATLPDPGLLRAAESATAAAELEHLFRIPFSPYWGPVLSVLYAHRDEVARVTPTLAATVCGLWLRRMPPEREAGRSFPWRREAAGIALALAQESQASHAEERYAPTEERRVAYEAMLHAAPDAPDTVADLCLQLAERRDASPAIQEREARARQEREAAEIQWRAANPERARQSDYLCRPIFPQGPLRGPWPDGPRRAVEGAFQAACLETVAFPALVRVRPEVALEVLLAVCIEEPQHENLYGGSMEDDCGVIDWRAGYPPLYFRGPFLAFLREAPEHGLSFVLRLINFATRRWSETHPRRMARLGVQEMADPGVTLTLDGQRRRWAGDARVFRWHHDFPPQSKVIPCALMALEKWLYEQLEQGADIEHWLKRILTESESVAFAAVLLELGKRHPVLLAAVLSPLLTAWQLYQWDMDDTIQRRGMSPGLMGWGMQPRQLAALAREWYNLPHRARVLRDLAVATMLSRPELHPFFVGVRGEWQSSLDPRGEPESLRLLIERLNPGNYTEHPQEDGSTRFEFAWPEDIQRRNDARQQELNEESRLLTFPVECRQRLEKETPVPEADLPVFWEALEAISSARRPAQPHPDDMPLRVEDALCGGIAVLLVLHAPWLAEHPDRAAWCRRTLEEVLRTSPPRAMFDVPDAAGSWHWEDFAGECGIALLMDRPDDILARHLTAMGVAAYRYGTTTLTMQRAFLCRERLGDEFDRLLHLALVWSGVRSLRDQAGRLQVEVDRWREAHERLVAGFVDRTMPETCPSLQQVNAEALAAHERLRPSPLFEDEDDAGSVRPKHTGNRRTLRPALPGIDLRVLVSAFSWLSPVAARDAEERSRWLALLREFLGLSLGLLPPVADSSRQEIDGYPSDYDNWVYRVVARTLPGMTASEDPSSLWRPILDLGAPAHEWVEHFFWEWFTEAVQVAREPQALMALWREMIRHALGHPRWDPQATRRSGVADVVYELLGCHWGVETIGADERFKAAIGGMTGVFEQAARRWLGMPKVAAGFARFIVKPSAEALLFPGVRWLYEAVQRYDQYDWRERQLDECLIGVLRACWDRDSRRVSGEAALREAFLGLLTSLASRSGHAAAVLRDQVLDSIGRQG